ncbi:MAG TPA: hypothetical protein VLL76_01640, partial [Candidatus Omnitrophota bacterium]|nr:hypothetical protein [Candidatus Omnitrophota bacterium]
QSTPDHLRHPPAGNRIGRYLGWFAAGFALTLVVMVAALTATRARITDCDGRFHDQDHFLAWCGSPAFQDYEHGAFAMRLEPEAVAHARAADVLVLGSSLAQNGFSSQATRDHFAGRGLRHFLLAFGHAETSVFPQELIRQLDLRPRLVIVNAADFFADQMSGVGAGVVYPSAVGIIEYRAKQLLQPIHAWACTAYPGLACGDAPTIYRSRRDGHWAMHNFPDRHVPVTLSGGIADPAVVTRQSALAVKLRAFLQARGACLVLSATPSEDGRHAAEARAIGAATGIPAIVPALDGLTSYDGAHLDGRSAEIFSAAVLAGLSEAEARCAAPAERNR